MGIAERREREREQRRLSIIEAAERIFFSKGYSGATMDQIAQDAELSKATLYLYFKGKDEVHREIVSRGMDILFDLIKGGIGAESSGIGKLEVIWDSWMRFHGQYADYCDALMSYETRDVEVGTEEEIEQWLNRYKVIHFTVKTVEEGMSDGSVRQDMDPARLALFFWSQVIGAIQLARFKKTLIKNLLKIQPDVFLGYFKGLVFEQMSPRRRGV
jgi:AcrR family transcriptional regulator